MLLQLWPPRSVHLGQGGPPGLLQQLKTLRSSDYLYRYIDFWMIFEVFEKVELDIKPKFRQITRAQALHVGMNVCLLSRSFDCICTYHLNNQILRIYCP
jgi:hypothetical protein